MNMILKTWDILNNQEGKQKLGKRATSQGFAETMIWWSLAHHITRDRAYGNNNYY